MTFLKAIVLGIVQGLTEFLPVSSSGHLAIIQNLMNIEEENILFFAAMLHLGTLISILLVYYKDVFFLIREFLLMIYELITGKGLDLKKSHYRKLGLLIITACIPTGIIGVTFSDFFESLFHSVFSIGIGLLITGTLLWFSERIGKATKNITTTGYGDAFIIGFFQAIAIAPGISRSGATIVGSLFRGLNRKMTVKFSFLISIPAVFGASAVELMNALGKGMDGSSMGMVLCGIVAATISGYAAIRILIRLITNRKLIYFSIYTWVLGTGIIIYSII